jgi:uncharacterized Fe-S radical SAM superfamily protein PflX
MGQYRPTGRVSAARYPEIARAPDAQEMAAAVAAARRVGLERLDGRAVKPIPYPRHRVVARV